MANVRSRLAQLERKASPVLDIAEAIREARCEDRRRIAAGEPRPPLTEALGDSRMAKAIRAARQRVWPNGRP